jgi:two-component system, NarL family, sensor kinase
MKINILILWLLFLTGTNVPAQQAYTDSAEKNIYTLPDDTVKVNRLNALAGRLQFANPVKAIAVLKSAISIAEKINYPLGASSAYGMQANLLFYEMKLDSAKLLIDKAYALVKNKKDIAHQNQVALLTNLYGSIHQQKQQYDSAVEKYLEAARIYTKTGNESKIIYSWYNLSVMYGFLQDTVKALYYARETNTIAVKTNDSNFIVRSLIVLSEAFLAIKKYDSASVLSQKGLAIATKQNVPFAIGKFNEMLGTCAIENSNKPAAAIAHFNLALQHFKEINIPYDVSRVLQKMGSAYLKANDYSNAVKYLTEATALAKELQLDQVLQYSLPDLVHAEEKLGHIKESFAYLKEYVAVNDSLQNRNNRKRVNELETKYQTEKKEALLQVQQATIARKNMWNYIFGISALALIVISALLYRNYRHKQRLQQQRIAELEIQHQLTATEAVLKGEEQERTRLAKDLHDGLGGMLSGIKYSFNTMKGNLVMTETNARAFERSMDMLDSSIKEMRRVAHNMMPEALVKFGLDTALKDFCNDVNSMGALQVAYQSIGLQNVSIPQTTAITIYRIVQELLHNTIKHAAAKTALVQVTNDNNKIAVTVEDDGKGFDTAILNSSRGMGWSNIKSRVEFLKGVLDVQSENEKGTSVHIEINI